MPQARRSGSVSFGEGCSTPARENRRQLVRRDDLELIEGALLRLLVEPPVAKLRCVAKTRPLRPGLPVIGVADNLDRFIGLELDEFERPGADGMSLAPRDGMGKPATSPRQAT